MNSTDTVVKVTTSLRGDEVKDVDRIKHLFGGNRYGRAGALRAMLRFALENEAEFLAWFNATNGQTVKEALE